MRWSKSIKKAKKKLKKLLEDFDNSKIKEIVYEFNDRCFDKNEVNYVIDFYRIVKKAYKKLKKNKNLEHKHLLALSIICEEIKSDIEEKLNNIYVW